jgi:stearoyl-CoA desaturase (delta-9 desaturase)
MTELLKSTPASGNELLDYPKGEPSAAESLRTTVEPRRCETAPVAKDIHETVGQRGGIWSGRVQWSVVLWIALVHLGALAAPFFFSWWGLGVFVFLYWVTGSLGVCLGYHRLLTHGSFQTYRPVRWFFALVGGLSGQGSAIEWVAKHRRHHAFSDQEGDPHSPRDGKWWSHMLWLVPDAGWEANQAEKKRWAADLVKDPVVLWIDRLFLPVHFLSGLSLLGLGYWLGGWYLAWSLLFWGVFFRMTFVFHATWCVNSATHLWGYRNYETTDDSRNCWWVSALTFGEGWHNNHHAYQRMARCGHRWWEIDLTYLVILAMERVGLAWRVVHAIPRRSKALAADST